MSRMIIVLTLMAWQGDLAQLADAQETTPHKAKRPNIILLLADDLGYGDLSSFGSPAVKTPHLDRLGKNGMRFTNFYAASAVCSPTRASVLTGRYPLRFGITRHFNDVNRWLPQSATTVAELLKESGYNTAHVGKWHLGGLHVDKQGRRQTDQPGPRQHGFDFYQTQIEQQPLRSRMGRNRTLFREGGTVLLRNDQRIDETDPYYSKHLTDANGDFAVEMIEKFAAEDKPFFLNVWWLVPHKPYEPAPEPHWSNTKAKGISDNQHCFRSMVQHMDAKIGQILDKLDELKIADNTLVLFTSDNGAAYEGFIGDLKGGKTDLHDGGLRVPMVVRWPLVIDAGETSEAFGHTNDLLPTFCDAAGIDLPKHLPLDGLSLLPHLKGEDAPGAEVRGTVFWQLDLYRNIQRHYPKPKPYATEVAMRGKWKLLALKGEPVELFDLEADPNEKSNVLEAHPKLVASLTTELRAWLDAPRTTARAQGTLPPFSWDRVPVYAHVGKSSGDFTPQELDFLADHFDFITIEKGQAASKYGNTEEGFTVAAREIKKRNPDAKVLFYWNASLESSTVRWGYKAVETFPQGGFLKDNNGDPVLRRKTVPNYDQRRPEVRQWWSDVAATAVREYGADGIFADAMGDPPRANQKTLDEQTVSQLRAARLAMLEQTRDKIGSDKLIIYNGLMRENRDNLLRVADGAMDEHFGHFANGSSKEHIAEAIAVAQAAGRDGKIVLLKGWPGFSYREPDMMRKPQAELAQLARERITFPLACYLVAAQPNCYFCYTWGYREKLGTFQWYPEFDKPLGPPKGDAERKGWTYQREFAHASVFVDLETRTAKIDWKR